MAFFKISSFCLRLSRSWQKNHSLTQKPMGILYRKYLHSQNLVDMDKEGIIPEIIDEEPIQTAQIEYPSGVSVHEGKELTPTQVKDQPIVHWEAEASKLYCLTMIDPDAPSRAAPALRDVCHWSVVNIPGNNVASGQTIVEYVGSGPPNGGGLHRYLFLIFEQKVKIVTDKFVPKNSREGRYKVKTREFIQKYDLGNPIAGNYYTAQYDDYVPILQAQYTTKI